MKVYHTSTKRKFENSNGTITTEAMVYVMNDGYEYGVPGKEYYEIIKQGYKDCSLDEKYLDEAVEKMKETVLNKQKQQCILMVIEMSDSNENKTYKVSSVFF